MQAILGGVLQVTDDIIDVQNLGTMHPTTKETVQIM